MRSSLKVSTLARALFTVYDSSDAVVTGLTTGSFTLRLALDATDDATAVTIAEIGNGRYAATFTPGSVGTWYLNIIHATHNVRGWEETWDVIATHPTGAFVTGTTTSAGTTTTIIDSARTEASTDWWKGSTLLITSGPAAGQSRLITAFTIASDTITVTPAFTAAPGSGATYEILPQGGADLRHVNGTAVNNLTGGAMSASVNGVQSGAITATGIATGAISAAKFAADAVTKLRCLISGTVGNTVTTTSINGVSSIQYDDTYKGCWFLLTTLGTGDSHLRQITGSVAATGTITFAPALPAAPTASVSTYEILPAAAVDVRAWNGSAPNNLVAGRVDASVGAMAADVMTAAALAADAVAEIQSGLGTGADLATIIAYVDALEARLTAGRALLLDNLAFLTAAPPTAAATATAVGALTKDGLTLLEHQGVQTSAGLCKVSGMAAGTPTFRDASDTANRIAAVCDADGNRTAVTITP